MQNHSDETKVQGTHCPNCGETFDINYGSFDFDVGHIYQPAYCEVCDSEWDDVYTLTGYRDLVTVEADKKV